MAEDYLNRIRYKEKFLRKALPALPHKHPARGQGVLCGYGEVWIKIRVVKEQVYGAVLVAWPVVTP